MSDGLLSIEGKGLILGNPLRYLDCHNEMDIKEIKRSYNDIVRIRLQNNHIYIPPNDPFKGFSTIEIDKANAQRAINLLSDPINLAVAKAFYIKNFHESRVIVENINQSNHRKSIKYVNAILNNNPQKMHIIILYAWLMSAQVNALFQYDNMVNIFRYAPLIINCDPWDGKISTDDNLKNDEIAKLAWHNFLFDFIRRAYIISGKNIDNAISMQMALEQLAAESSRSALLDKCITLLYRIELDRVLKTAFENLDDIKEKLERSNNNACIANLIKEIKNIIVPAQKLKRLYKNRHIEIKYSIQKISHNIKGIAVKINNDHSDYYKAIDLANIAKEMASDDDLRAELDKDIEIYKNNYYLQNGSSYQSASTSGFSRFIRGFVAGHPVRAFYIVMLLIGLLIAVIPKETNKKVAPPGQYKTDGIKSSTSAISPNRDKQTIENTINRNKQRLKDFEAKIEMINLKLSLMDNEISGIEYNLNKYENMINMGFDYNHIYDSLYQVYENRIAAYNNEVNIGRKYILEYDNLIDSTNNIINYYNVNYAK